MDSSRGEELVRINYPRTRGTPKYILANKPGPSRRAAAFSIAPSLRTKGGTDTGDAGIILNLRSKRASLGVDLAAKEEALRRLLASEEGSEASKTVAEEKLHSHGRRRHRRTRVDDSYVLKEAAEASQVGGTVLFCSLVFLSFLHGGYHRK